MVRISSRMRMKIATCGASAALACALVALWPALAAEKILELLQ